MTAEALRDLMQELGFSLRAEGDTLRVTPAERLTPQLRRLLQEHKAALLDLFNPQVFTNVRTILPKLEKLVEAEHEEAEAIIINHCDHTHSRGQVAQVERLLAAQGGGTVIHVGGPTCTVCQVLGLVEAQEEGEGEEA